MFGNLAGMKQNKSCVVWKYLKYDENNTLWFQKCERIFVHQCCLSQISSSFTPGKLRVSRNRRCLMTNFRDILSLQELVYFPSHPTPATSHSIPRPTSSPCEKPVNLFLHTCSPRSVIFGHSASVISRNRGLLPSAATPWSCILHPDKSNDMREGRVPSNSTPASVTCSQ